MNMETIKMFMTIWITLEILLNKGLKEEKLVSNSHSWSSDPATQLPIRLLYQSIWQAGELSMFEIKPIPAWKVGSWR